MLIDQMEICETYMKMYENQINSIDNQESLSATPPSRTRV